MKKILEKVLCEKTVYLMNCIYVVADKINVDLNTYVFSNVLRIEYFTQIEAQSSKILHKFRFI